jgi:hypothetical protein
MPTPETRPKRPPKIMVVVEPVTVKRETAARMLEVSLAHFDRKIYPHLKVLRSGNLRLVPVDEIKAWVRRNAHPPLAGDDA